MFHATIEQILDKRGDFMVFSDIQGQSHAVEILQQAITGGHVSHGYLFIGPDGVGKKDTALALAQSLNCTHDSTVTDGCGHCPSCLKIQNGAHPDVFFVEPSGTSIKIEQIRLLNAKAALKAYEGRTKVIIINDAHLMTPEAANSLLKTLEEPLPDTIFILITAQPQQLPVTILSRIQQITFKPLSQPIIESILMKAQPALASRIGLAAALAQGSASRALALLSDEALGAARNTLYTILADLPRYSVGELLLACEQWDKDRKMVHALLTFCQLWYRDALVWHTAKNQALLINQDQLATFVSCHYAVQSLIKIIGFCQEGQNQLERNASPRLVLEVCLLKSRTALLEA